jgi:hypothetical protein
MWEPRRLTTLWTSTACYRDKFTFIIIIIIIIIWNNLAKCFDFIGHGQAITTITLAKFPSLFTFQILASKLVRLMSYLNLEGLRVKLQNIYKFTIKSITIITNSKLLLSYHTNHYYSVRLVS